MLSTILKNDKTSLAKLGLDAKNKSLLVILTLILPKLAIAHPGHGLEASGSGMLSSLTSGLMHPLTGLDHLVLALGMGMLFTQVHNFKRGFIALALGLGLGFILSLGLGLNLNLAMIETGILLSVILLTLALLSQHFNTSTKSNLKTSSFFGNLRTIAPLIFAAFALFHGAAHGLEVPANAITLGFFTGMMLSMLGLYCAGNVVITLLNKHSNNSFLIQRIMAVVGLCAVLFI